MDRTLKRDPLLKEDRMSMAGERPPVAERTDEDLVVMARAAPEGDERAFEELIHRYEAMVRANCRQLTASHEESRDLAQDVLVKAYRGLPGFELRSTFRTWLWGIKLNRCRDFLDRRRVRSREEIVPPDDSRLETRTDARTRPDQMAERAEVIRLVQATLDELPDEPRIALVLRDLDGLTYPEMAERLGIGESAAKMRVSRARQAFRERYRARLDRGASS